MSTKNFINVNGTKVKRNLNNRALVPTKGSGLHQELLATDFKNPTTGPGGKNDCEYDFTQTYDVELEKAWMIRFKMNTTDLSNSLTLYSDCYTLIKSIELRYNNSNGKAIWKYNDNYMIRLLRNEALKEHGDRIAQKRAESDNEFNGITGVQVVNGGPQYFYINLFDLFPHFRGVSVNGILQHLKVSVEFQPVPDSAELACQIGKSSTAANAYTKDVTFTEMSFIRVYEVITDTRMISRPPLDLVLFDIPYFENQVVDMSWNSTADTYKFNVYDLCKLPNFKKIVCFVTKDGTAYDSADAGKTYSGHNYIYWKIEEKNGGSNRKTLDFTTSSVDNVRRLRNYEIERNRKTYGVDLPISVHANTDNLNKYFLFMTEIYFDEIDNSEQAHETYPDYDSSKNDYIVTLQATTAGLGANCKLHIVAFTNEFYRFNQKLKIEPVDRLE